MLAAQHVCRDLSSVKRFHMIPMDEEEAIAQMELLGHDFYVFFNVNQNQINGIRIWIAEGAKNN